MESVVYAVMHLEMLNQDNTKMEENMEKESLLLNISQGSNLPTSTFFLHTFYFLETLKIIEKNFSIPDNLPHPRTSVGKVW